jgi:hypothetical protein
MVNRRSSGRLTGAENVVKRRARSNSDSRRGCEGACDGALGVPPRSEPAPYARERRHLLARLQISCYIFNHKGGDAIVAKKKAAKKKKK